MAGLFGMLALVFLGNRVLYAAPRAYTVMSCGFLLTGPALNYVERYFGTTVFAACAALTWMISRLVASRRERWQDAFLLAASVLILGLIRT